MGREAERTTIRLDSYLSRHGCGFRGYHCASLRHPGVQSGTLRPHEFSVRRFAGLHFYLSALSSREFWADLWRTLDFTVVSIVLEITFGLYRLTPQRAFPGVRFLRSIIIIPWALPTVVSGSLWKLIFHGEYGVLNEILLRLKLIPNFRSWLGNPVTAMRTIIIADVWKMAPLSVIFFLAALQSSNKDIHEAAMVDGANVFQRFFKLTLPDLMPTIIIVAVMRTVDKFKSFDLFYLMTRGGPSNATRTLMYDA